MIGIARILSGAFDRARPLASPDPRLADEVDIVRRIAAVRDALLAVAPDRAAQFWRERGLQERLLSELQWVREEALALEGLVGRREPDGTATVMRAESRDLA